MSETLEARKARIRAQRDQHQRSRLAHLVDPHRTARILLALALLALCILATAGAIQIAGALP